MSAGAAVKIEQGCCLPLLQHAQPLPHHPNVPAARSSCGKQCQNSNQCITALLLCRRSQTASSWKALRVHMEQQLAEKLAQQQADLDEQLAFVQVSSSVSCTVAGRAGPLAVEPCCW